MLVLVVTNDLGSGLLYFGIFLAMLYIATARLSLTCSSASASSPSAAAAAYTQISHVHERVTIWLHPWTDDEGVLPADRRPRVPAGLRRATSS